MKVFTLRLDDNLHNAAVSKAKRELRSLNAVIGRLVEKWIAGEVDLQPPEANKEEQPEQT